ncbi:MAG TPA: tetratricopeptide repeat protein [Thermoanaerobaculia bacterium]
MAARARLVALAALAVLAGTALACATTTRAAPLDRAAVARLFAERHVRAAPAVVPFELTEEMRAWAHRTVPDPNLPVERRLHLLLRALIDPGGLGVAYDADATGTAAEVFASRRANCLAFTNLFVGMARELELPVFYLEIGDLQRFEREGDLVVAAGHVSAAASGYADDRYLDVLDFTVAPIADYRQLRRLSDREAIALHYVNRGGELLRAGRYADALPWLDGAVALAPDQARGWVNLGVARRRSGDAAGAEAAYRRALEADPDSAAAYENLASLLRRSSRDREAEELLVLAARVGGRNPFSYLSLGDVSLAHGRLDEARRLYRRALGLYGEHAEPYAAMGQWALAAGEVKEARRWLAKAAAIDGQNDRVRRLASALASSAGGVA